MFFRFVELCFTRNQCVCFQVILYFCLFLIQNIWEDNNKIKKVIACQNFKIDGLSKNKPPRRFQSLYLNREINKFACLDP